MNEIVRVQIYFKLKRFTLYNDNYILYINAIHLYKYKVNDEY